MHADIACEILIYIPESSPLTPPPTVAPPVGGADFAGKTLLSSFNTAP
jgi:hypothetical protein